ncbi:hypothetical protein DYBT9623_00030 [Dyadobacter sp. CECT 9623]|uniref:CdiI immunity protein domain-containing protein n=2 Tax=Dyadobacter linearis TaxID=2823330 RepID=A0ABM8UJB0_9BACT|nr:hypothetical protein DYBT9623_00030 [Dyadobacter sp. CECT 9623]
MDMYLYDEISAKTFSDEFYYSYDLEVDIESLVEIEKEAFAELSKVSDRFSEFEDDHLKFPLGFFNAYKLKQKIIETKEKLKEQSPI